MNENNKVHIMLPLILCLILGFICGFGFGFKRCADHEMQNVIQTLDRSQKFISKLDEKLGKIKILGWKTDDTVTK